jgi:hypothetical protein
MTVVGMLRIVASWFDKKINGPGTCGFAILSKAFGVVDEWLDYGAGPMAVLSYSG